MTETDKFIKHSDGKTRYSLIPPASMAILAEILTHGAEKYADNNWRLAEDVSTYIDALYRHLEAWRSGETHDPDSGYNHLGHALCNLVFLYELTRSELEE